MKHCLGCGENRHAGLCKPTARNAAPRQPVTQELVIDRHVMTRYDLARGTVETVVVKPRGHAQPKTGMTPAARQRAYRARKRLG